MKTVAFALGFLLLLTSGEGEVVALAVGTSLVAVAVIASALEQRR